MLPSRIHLPKKLTDKLRQLQSATKVTPNIVARLAIMLAIESKAKISGSKNGLDSSGQVLDRDVLFGENVLLYELLINQLIHDQKLKLPQKEVIVFLIEQGVHKMGHIRSVEEFCQLAKV